jgi:hypothetical protein
LFSGFEGILNFILQTLSAHDGRLEELELQGSRMAELEEHRHVLEEKLKTLAEQVSGLESERSSMQDAHGNMSSRLDNLEASVAAGARHFGAILEAGQRLTELDRRLDAEVSNLAEQLALARVVIDAHGEAQEQGGWSTKADLNLLQQGEQGSRAAKDVAALAKRLASLEEQQAAKQAALEEEFQQIRLASKEAVSALEERLDSAEDHYIEVTEMQEADLERQLSDRLPKEDDVRSPRKEVPEPNSEPTPERQASPRSPKKDPEVTNKLKKIENRVLAIEKRQNKMQQSIEKNDSNQPLDIEKKLEQVLSRQSSKQHTQPIATQAEGVTQKMLDQMKDQMNTSLQLSIEQVKGLLLTEINNASSETLKEVQGMRKWTHEAIQKLRTDLTEEVKTLQERVDAEAQQKDDSQAELRQGQRYLSEELQRIEMQFTAVSTNCLACGMNPRPTEPQLGLTSQAGRSQSLGRNDVGAPVSQFLSREWEFDQIDTTRRPLRKGGGFTTASSHFYSDGMPPSTSMSQSRSSPAIGSRRKREAHDAPV